MQVCCHKCKVLIIRLWPKGLARNLTGPIGHRPGAMSRGGIQLCEANWHAADEGVERRRESGG